MGKNILSRRPTGYGENDISEDNPELKKYKNILIKIGNAELKIKELVEKNGKLLEQDIELD